MNSRSSKEVISDIKNLVDTKGFIYVICLILIEDFHYDVEEMHNVDHRARLNKNEVSLLLGFLIQNEINLEHPENQYHLIELKRRTYELMEELHRSFMNPFIEKFKPIIEKKDNYKPSKREFFGGEGMFIEPIFYSGDGVYDFQYLDFLDQKYKYDRDWLKSKYKFDFERTKIIVSEIKNIHRNKIEKVNFLGLKENKNKLIKKLRKDKSIPKKQLKENIDDWLSALEIYQFSELFKTGKESDKEIDLNQVKKEGWESFYNGLIELFTIKSSDFNVELEVNNFFENFCIPSYSKERNAHFQNAGDFNLFTARPIIPLNDQRYFVPISFSVFEAVYESPFYWLWTEKSYRNKLAENRGKSGEEITYDLLVKVFGKSRVYKSVKIESKKGFDDTDIDVLCILGSKAMCVQVKSKKLTQLSRKGDYDQLQIDFQGAVQDAFEQGLISRERILDKTATFYNNQGKKIYISEDIEEVFILGITTENYPTLTHQTHTLLEKKEIDPFPLFTTIFDLDLLTYYLNNPFDFLYYVRQRIALIEYFNAEEEMHYLGYHLIHKLWKNHEYNFSQIDSSYGQLIDRNYYPYRLGIETSSENDKIRNRWKNSHFERLCNEIQEMKSPKVTDVIFHLLDWSKDSIENLIKLILDTKRKTLINNRWHNFSMLAGPERSTFGLTFISWGNNNIHELMDRLLLLSDARKYKSKADIWIGLGALKDSGRMVDTFVFSNKKWEYDHLLEEDVKILFEGKNKGTPIKFGKKIGRNEFCPCGSGVKYKKCCGKKY